MGDAHSILTTCTTDHADNRLGALAINLAPFDLPSNTLSPASLAALTPSTQSVVSAVLTREHAIHATLAANTGLRDIRTILIDYRYADRRCYLTGVKEVEGCSIRLFYICDTWREPWWWGICWYVGSVQGFVEVLVRSKGFRGYPARVDFKLPLQLPTTEPTESGRATDLPRPRRSSQQTTAVSHTPRSRTSENTTTVLSLPSELRNHVYRLLARDVRIWHPLERTSGDTLALFPNQDMASLLQVNRQLRQEVLEELRWLSQFADPHAFHTVSVRASNLDASQQLLAMPASAQLTDILLRFDGIPPASTVRATIKTLVSRLCLSPQAPKRSLRIHVVYCGQPFLQRFGWEQNPMLSPSSLTLSDARHLDVETELVMYTSQCLHCSTPSTVLQDSGALPIARLALVLGPRDVPAAFACVSSDTQFWLTLLTDKLKQADGAVIQQSILQDLGIAWPQRAESSEQEMEVLRKWVRRLGRFRVVKLRDGRMNKVQSMENQGLMTLRVDGAARGQKVSG